jgi:hypothetical protein
MVHLHIPNTVVIGPRQRYRFSGEELLIVCLTRIATGDPWTRLIPSHFGGDDRRWSAAFHWFIDHLFINFYHKISARSIEGWIGHINEFKKIFWITLLSQHIQLNWILMKVWLIHKTSFSVPLIVGEFLAFKTTPISGLVRSCWLP